MGLEVFTKLDSMLQLVIDYFTQILFFTIFVLETHFLLDLETIWKIWNLYSVNRRMNEFQFRLFINDLKDVSLKK